jgi:malonyl-CoA O-methyltransferase
VVRVPPVPDRAAVSRVFERVSSDVDAWAFVLDDVRQRLLERLAPMTVVPARVLELGGGTGRGALALAQVYPAAYIVACDLSIGMCRRARRAVQAEPRITVVAADAEQLPLSRASVDLVAANLLVHWCSLDRLMAEAARVLVEGGLFIFSTLGPDSLIELRRAWAAVDDHPHVHTFFDMHVVGDRLLAAGFADPVMDVERVTVTYATPAALIAELRAVGGASLAAARRRTLTGTHRWARFLQALEAFEQRGRYPLTLELVFGHAWARGLPDRAGPGGEVSVPLDALHRRRRTL